MRALPGALSVRKGCHLASGKEEEGGFPQVAEKCTAERDVWPALPQEAERSPLNRSCQFLLSIFSVWLGQRDSSDRTAKPLLETLLNILCFCLIY